MKANKIIEAEYAAKQAIEHDSPVYLYGKIGGYLTVAPEKPEGFYLITGERVPVWRGRQYVTRWILSRIRNLPY